MGRKSTVEFSAPTRTLNQKPPTRARRAPNRGRGSTAGSARWAPPPPPDRAHLYRQHPRGHHHPPPHPSSPQTRRATRQRPRSRSIPPPKQQQPPRCAAAAGTDVDELRRRLVPARLGPRLRRHRPNPRPPRLLLLLLLLLHRRPRTQARRPRRPRRRQAAFPKGAGGGVAAGEGVQAERAAGGRREGEAGQGGRGRRAVPAQGGPRGARRLRAPPPRAPRHVRLLPRRPRRRRRRRRGYKARRLGHRRRVRAHLRGQGRRLDARRRRPLEDVRRVLQADPSHEELRGRQLIAKTIIQIIDPTTRNDAMPQLICLSVCLSELVRLKVCAMEEAWLYRSSMHMYLYRSRISDR
uniref:Uncharacterized protein n=1 Tax=Oryza nivara TaxID=4536 RepID=A0A0E0HT41_ORYNI